MRGGGWGVEGGFSARYGELGMSKRSPLSYVAAKNKEHENFFDLICGVWSTL